MLYGSLIVETEICIVDGAGTIVGTTTKYYEDDGFQYRIKCRRIEYEKVASDSYVYPYYEQSLPESLLHLKSYYESCCQSGLRSRLNLSEGIAFAQTHIGSVEFYLVKV